MRPQGQGPKRNNNNMRGGRNNRHSKGGGGGGGGGNPMHRGFESNGPDVKIRGTAQHIVEKYTQLGRDAQLSGDHVLAESYLQYAEHYYRMIAAYQAQFAPEGAVREEGDAEGAEDNAEGMDTEDMGGGNFRPNNNYRDNNRQNYRNDGGQRYGRNNGPRPEETEQPPVAFPQRDEQQAQEAARNNQGGGNRQRFDKRERFSRDRNQQQTGNEAPVAVAETTAEALPSFLTRTTRRRGRTEETENTEGANNNSVPTPPASEA